MEFSQREFRDALGAYPTGVAVVTARSQTGLDVGVTINSLTSVSLDPPLVLWCLDRQAYSWQAFEAATHFAINVLSVKQLRLSQQFATAGAVKWAGVDFERWSSGCAILRGCIANLECERHAVLDGGDHEIIVGRVNCLRRDSASSPLVFHGGNYRALSSDSLTGG